LFFILRHLVVTNFRSSVDIVAQLGSNLATLDLENRFAVHS
jgi:hypothetical protein